MEEIKAGVEKRRKEIKHFALAEILRHGLLPLLHTVSMLLQNEIKEKLRRMLGEHGLRPLQKDRRNIPVEHGQSSLPKVICDLLDDYSLRRWPLCPECEVDPKDGFVHIRNTSSQKVFLKITKEHMFCPNELLVLVVDILQDAHRNLCQLGVTDLIHDFDKGRTIVAYFMSVDIKVRQYIESHCDLLNERRYDDFIAILVSNVRLDMVFENPCEVFKAFSAKGPYKNIGFIENLPMQSVVSIISNCSVFATYLNINLRSRTNLLIKVSLHIHVHDKLQTNSYTCLI